MTRRIRPSIFTGKPGGITRTHRRPIPTPGCTRKRVGREAKLRYLGHLLTENRHGFIIDTAVTAASGTAERDAAIVMLGELPLTRRQDDPSAPTRRMTHGPGSAAVRQMRITPHVAATAARLRRQCDRRPDGATRGIRAESTQTQAHRASLRLDENDRALAEAAASRRPPRRLAVWPSPPPPTTWCAGGTCRRTPRNAFAAPPLIGGITMNTSPIKEEGSPVLNDSFQHPDSACRLFFKAAMQNTKDTRKMDHDELETAMDQSSSQKRAHFARLASGIESCRTSTGNMWRPRTLHNQ